jgi:hypothetical protein
MWCCPDGLGSEKCQKLYLRDIEREYLQPRSRRDPHEIVSARARWKYGRSFRSPHPVQQAFMAPPLWIAEKQMGSWQKGLTANALRGRARRTWLPAPFSSASLMCFSAKRNTSYLSCSCCKVYMIVQPLYPPIRCWHLVLLSEQTWLCIVFIFYSIKIQIDKTTVVSNAKGIS